MKAKPILRTILKYLACFLIYALVFWAVSCLTRLLFGWESAEPRLIVFWAALMCLYEIGKDRHAARKRKSERGKP